MDRYEALERLAKLKEQGIISDQEFILEKHAILSSPTQSGARFPPSADLSGGLHGSQQIVHMRTAPGFHIVNCVGT